MRKRPTMFEASDALVVLVLAVWVAWLGWLVAELVGVGA